MVPRDSRWPCTLVAGTQLAGLLMFLAGFLLAKVEVTQRSHQACALPGSQPAFDRVVWLVVDGLRFDQAAGGALDCSRRPARPFGVLEQVACELVSMPACFTLLSTGLLPLEAGAMRRRARVQCWRASWQTPPPPRCSGSRPC